MTQKKWNAKSLYNFGSAPFGLFLAQEQFIKHFGFVERFWCKATSTFDSLSQDCDKFYFKSKKKPKKTIHLYHLVATWCEYCRPSSLEKTLLKPKSAIFNCPLLLEWWNKNNFELFDVSYLKFFASLMNVTIDAQFNLVKFIIWIGKSQLSQFACRSW